MNASRRLKRIQIMPGVITNLARGTYRVTKNPLPEDARIAGSYYDARCDAFGVTMTSEEWPEILEGMVVPLCDGPVIERVE